MSYTYLAHHGIKGQKWGVRRWQNEDGTRNAAGKERYGKKLAKAGIKGAVAGAAAGGALKTLAAYQVSKIGTSTAFAAHKIVAARDAIMLAQRAQRMATIMGMNSMAVASSTMLVPAAAFIGASVAVGIGYKMLKNRQNKKNLDKGKAVIEEAKKRSSSSKK